MAIKVKTCLHKMKGVFLAFFRCRWEDSRSYWNRFGITFPIVLLFCLTFLFYGPYEVTVTNAKSLSFSVKDVLEVMGVFSLAVLAAASAILPLLRGRVFNAAATLLFALSVCGYLQTFLFNGQMALLDGNTISWNAMKSDMLINLLIWGLLLAVPYIVLHYNKRLWRNGTSFISLMLAVMQLTGFVSLAATEDTALYNADAYSFLDYNDFLQYGQDGNIVVFVLDRFDYQYYQQVLDESPAFFDGLDGFTAYSDAISYHGNTQPGLNFILTNYTETAFVEPSSNYFMHSWNHGEKHILSDLKKAGYTIDLYAGTNDLLGVDAAPFSDLVSNIGSLRELKPVPLVVNLSKLTLYRSAPLCMKPFFMLYTDDVNRDTSTSGTQYYLAENRYSDNVDNITASQGKKYFKFYHFQGMHGPFTLDENGQKVGDVQPTASQTARGNFHMLYGAFEKMKSLGIYKDTAIIITADHGNVPNVSYPLEDAIRILMLYKPAGSEGTPLRYSDAPVSHWNIPATIIEEAGLNPTNYGLPLEKVTQENTPVRTYCKTDFGANCHEGTACIYEITGPAKDFANWKMVKTEPIAYPFN